MQLLNEKSHRRQVLRGWHACVPFVDRTKQTLAFAALLAVTCSTAASVAGPPYTELKLVAPDAAAGDLFGLVAIDGDTIIVGAPGDDTGGANRGSASVYVRNGCDWEFQAQLLASNGAAGHRFGGTAVSADTAVVGVAGAYTSQGTAYVFVRNGTTWTEQAQLFADQGKSFDFFGNDVAIDGDTVVVGVPADDGPAGADQGSAYVFVRNETSWTQQAQLTAADAAASDHFGTSVAIHGDTIIVGATDDDGPAGNFQGSAYIFVRNGTTWTEQAHLFASDAAALDLFGNSVGLSGDTAIVGARWEGTLPAMSEAGAVYVFERAGSTWTQQAKLLASDRGAGDYFGSDVAIDGNHVLVGAGNYDGDAGINQGAAYLFVRSGLTWLESARLIASDVAPGDVYGSSVSLSNGTAIVGATSHDDLAGADQGAAYVYFADDDGDGVGNECDNCPLSNADQADCQPNGIGDACEIADMTSNDCQPDGIPDECELVGNDSIPLGGDSMPDECNCLNNSDCLVGETCNMTTNLCELAGVPCLTNIDCDDDLVCSCDTCSGSLCQHATGRYGNVNCSLAPQPDLDDILCVLAGFASFAACPNGDIHPPCTGNDAISLDDILAVLAAFAGTDPCGC